MKAVRARPLDRPGQFLELGGERLEFGGERLGVKLGHVGGGIEQGVEHHRDARQDSFFDAVEGVIETRLLLCDTGHGRRYVQFGLKLGER